MIEPDLLFLFTQFVYLGFKRIFFLITSIHTFGTPLVNCCANINLNRNLQSTISRDGVLPYLPSLLD